MNFLHINQLSFRFPQHIDPIVNGLTCSFPDGWTALVGANGCGKTTLMKLICGDLLPEEGLATGENDFQLCPQ